MHLSVWSSPTKITNLGFMHSKLHCLTTPKISSSYIPILLPLTQREFRAEFDLYLKELIGIKF